MTGVVPRSSLSYTVPQSQNTAPVIEFRCLYTHDIKQKRKRWQDGMLKFHTFNKRIMVYDTSGGYVGDKHGRDGTIEEGDELKLDTAVLVEVQEPVGRTETDLTPLFQWKTTVPSSGGPDLPTDCPVQTALRSQPLKPLKEMQSPLSSNRTRPRSTVMPRHKSLNVLLGPRKGLSGKAIISTKSPYEERQEQQEQENGSIQLAKRHYRSEINADVTCISESPSKRTALSRETRPDSPHSGSEHLAKRKKVVAQEKRQEPFVEGMGKSALTSKPVTRAVQSPEASGDSREERALPKAPGSQARHNLDDLSGLRDDANKETETSPARDLSTYTLREANVKLHSKPSQLRALRLVKAPPRSMLLCRPQNVTQSSNPLSGTVVSTTQPSCTKTANDLGFESIQSARRDEVNRDESKKPHTGVSGYGRRRDISPSLPTKAREARRNKGVLANLDAALSDASSGEFETMTTAPRRSADSTRGDQGTRSGVDGISDDSAALGAHEEKEQISQDDGFESAGTASNALRLRKTSPKQCSKPSRQLCAEATEPSVKQSPTSPSDADGRKGRPTSKKTRVSKKANSKSTVDDALEPGLKADQDVGPWSTEAFDLFDWRPPDPREK